MDEDDIKRIAEVSIRAPARGATKVWRLARFEATSFYPRPRTGGDETKLSRVVHAEMFLSAPPHGGRRFMACCW